MSRNVLERVLWQLSVERAAKDQFRKDARLFLSRFALSEEEVDMVIGFDVAALQGLGVNPMLTMGFWQELSEQRDMSIYKKRLGATDEQLAGFSAALKG
ncbi:extradiol ring-cleavage dioxygenase [Pseudomonas sp. N-137]|uniref:extradiol ring-cleavage dioxygenase n=1 Tax=Pseudomonas sp. N-137 TaxID=3108452 RepID=UPI002ADEA6B6|nr:extradiol ring-cleavage dioxygenase [Pseudomonas sp. N-137]MEA1028069.1 extradiol ring-cleavage dioxygenase [Pseudomonas sp. N-137]